MKIVTIIQARMGSTRLPHKVMLPILGAPLLQRMLERVSAAKHVDQIVVATTTEPEDDLIAEFCHSWNVNLFRGSANDLLDRHVQAARFFKADAVVKIPSDCPLIDPQVIDRIYQYYMDHHASYDFVSNLHPATYPDGNDVEIMSMETLETAWREAKRPLEREHTTPFIWENGDRFRLGNIVWETGNDFSMSHRWTIDYEEDYIFIKTVFEHLYPLNPLFTIDDIITLQQNNPEISAINNAYAGVNWYRHHVDELKTISRNQTKSI